MRVPSGLQTGESSPAVAVVRRRTAPLATSASQRLFVLRFFCTDHSCTVKTTVLPLGDTEGDRTRFMAQRSCGVMTRLLGANAAPVSATARKTTRVRDSF